MADSKKEFRIFKKIIDKTSKKGFDMKHLMMEG
jgi:hypothetical protein